MGPAHAKRPPPEPQRQKGRGAGGPVAADGPAPLAAPETECLALCLEALLHSYRHAAVGRRCHGIIHNLNTPLQVISLQLDLLQQKAEGEGALLDSLGEGASALRALAADRRDRLHQVAQEVENLQALVRRLAYQGLHEAREDRLYLDLNLLYREELALYQDDLFFKHQVTKEFCLSGDLPPISGHYIDFSQSFRNLVDNALEAMAGVNRRLLRVVTEFSDGVRRVRVGDSGTGIPPQLLPHLGRPFFSTKRGQSPGHAGLGLFLAKRLVAPYGGRLAFDSRPGETWVTLELPVSAESPTDPAQRP